MNDCQTAQGDNPPTGFFRCHANIEGNNTPVDCESKCITVASEECDGFDPGDPCEPEVAGPGPAGEVPCACVTEPVVDNGSTSICKQCVPKIGNCDPGFVPNPDEQFCCPEACPLETDFNFCIEPGEDVPQDFFRCFAAVEEENGPINTPFDCCVPDEGQEEEESACTDNKDNDCDTLVDCNDLDCKNDPSCKPPNGGGGGGGGGGTNEVSALCNTNKNGYGYECQWGVRVRDSCCSEPEKHIKENRRQDDACICRVGKATAGPDGPIAPAVPFFGKMPAPAPPAPEAPSIAGELPPPPMPPTLAAPERYLRSAGRAFQGAFYGDYEKPSRAPLIWSLVLFLLVSIGVGFYMYKDKTVADLFKDVQKRIVAIGKKRKR